MLSIAEIPVVGIGTLELPLQSQPVGIEVVILGRLEVAARRQVGFLPYRHGVATAVTVLVITDDEPVVDPFGGLQMHHASVGMLILEVDEPVFTVLGVHPGPLMRSVDLRFALGQAHILLIGSVGIFGAQNHLPTVFHASGGRHDIVVAVTFVEFGALDGGLVFMTVVDDACRPGHTGAVGREGRHEEHRLDAGS